MEHIVWHSLRQGDIPESDTARLIYACEDKFGNILSYHDCFYDSNKKMLYVIDTRGEREKKYYVSNPFWAYSPFETKIPNNILQDGLIR